MLAKPVSVHVLKQNVVANFVLKLNFQLKVTKLSSVACSIVYSSSSGVDSSGNSDSSWSLFNFAYNVWYFTLVIFATSFLAAVPVRFDFCTVNWGYLDF